MPLTPLQTIFALDPDLPLKTLDQYHQKHSRLHSSTFNASLSQGESDEATQDLPWGQSMQFSTRCRSLGRPANSLPLSRGRLLPPFCRARSTSRSCSEPFQKYHTTLGQTVMKAPEWEAPGWGSQYIWSSSCTASPQMLNEVTPLPIMQESGKISLSSLGVSVQAQESSLVA